MKSGRTLIEAQPQQQPNQSKNYVAFVSTFHPTSDLDKGHTTLELYKPTGEKVMVLNSDGDLVHGRVSVFPSSRPYTKFPTPIQKMVDYFGIAPKANIVADLTGVPVDAFSTKNYSADIKIQKKEPDCIQMIPVSEKTVQLVQEKHQNLANGKEKFVLNYKTGITPFILHALEGGKRETELAKTSLGHSMPDDLHFAGGWHHHPDMSDMPENYNCAGAVYDILQKSEVLPPDTSPLSLYPQDVQTLLAKHGAKDVTHKPHKLPFDMQETLHIAKEKYSKRHHSFFGHALDKLTFEPDLERDLKNIHHHHPRPGSKTEGE